MSKYTAGSRVLVRVLVGNTYEHEAGTVVTGRIKYMLQDEIGPRVAHLRVAVSGWQDVWEPVNRLQPAT